MDCVDVGVDASAHAPDPTAVIANFTAMMKQRRPRDRYEPSVIKNQSTIDCFIDLTYEFLNKTAPTECFIFIIDELTASSKACRENNSMQDLYWICLTNKIIAAIMNRLQEFSPEVQTKFGSLLQYGTGCCVDQGENAVKVYKAAAEKYPLAQYYLGYMYRNGSGIPQDNVLARKWYTIAAQNGHPHAQHSLKFMDLNGI